MASQKELDHTYLSMAETWATLSKAQRKKVGCLIVKDGCIISDGFNGTPSGFNNSCEHNCWLLRALLQKRYPEPIEMADFNGEGLFLVTKPEVLHAESNAITKLAKSTQSSIGATMYITINPCVECAKLIIQSGIKRVVYKHFYKDLEGVDLLTKANIQVNNII